MKIIILALLILSLTVLSPIAQAGDGEKHLSVGFGTYALAIVYDDNSSLADDTYSGTAISVFYAPTDQFAFRGSFYSTEHDDFSFLENDGYDLAIYLGTGLATQGFKAYIGGGIFNETQEAPGSPPFNEDFSGLQFSGGVGYNWDVIGLDFVLSIRDSSDYEDISGGEAAAASGSLILSIRI